MRNRVLQLCGLVAALLALYWGYATQCSSTCTLTGSPDEHRSQNGHLDYQCAGKPHQSSWGSWWHPQRSDGIPAEHKQGAGAITEDWNILYHLGGNGPWVEKVIGALEARLRAV